ncbi:FMN-dependent NADH-azoreductase [Spiroplasma alleghenense]|uniref:FMN dependent NADH:quinone oxidoreductase n=1 Tax=Spiroplasma alleghenense TaxID=216931 RepID=A0A345Z4E9_9MOLU|nr:FMN-dependent NADH-azoreductase [Spiroplasma alleghenense]AXK51478.1 azoreductase [Spiroplasma alleghenense]
MKNKILVINGSVSPIEKSFSVALTNLFIDEYKKNDPEAEFIHLDLNTNEMAGKTLTRENMGTYFNEKDSMAYIEQLKDVNKVIIGCPMNNFNVSGIVKNYLEHVLLANQTFSYKYSKKGDAIGLLKHLKVQILTTQGAPFGWYLFGNHTEFLKGTWEFMGAQVNSPVLLAGTKVAPVNAMDPKAAALTVKDEVIKAAKSF